MARVCNALQSKGKGTVPPNVITFCIVLKACAQSMSFHFGQHLSRSYPHFLGDASIRACLISLYGKCGKLSVCQQLFAEIPSHEIEIKLCNAMMHAYGRNGQLNSAMKLFENMCVRLTPPNRKTFTVLLNACSHCGDVDTALQIWQHCIECDRIKYDEYVVTPFIDTLSRKGRLGDAYSWLLEIEHRVAMDDAQWMQNVWMSLLSGCKKHQAHAMAHTVYAAIKHRYQAHKECMACAAVLMSHLYASDGSFEDVTRIRTEMADKQWKSPTKGESHIDIYGAVHRFRAGDAYKRYARYAMMDEKLEQLFAALETKYGFTHDWSVITRELKSVTEMTYELRRHSEKLALVYALLSTPSSFDIFIHKNLRICNDCHEAFKLIAKMENRSITINDNSRIHVFECGECSCGDYY